MKWNKILLKLKVNNQEKFWAKFQQFLSIFHCMNESSQNSDCIWQIFQPILAISCKNLLDFYQIKQKL